MQAPTSPPHCSAPLFSRSWIQSAGQEGDGIEVDCRLLDRLRSSASCPGCWRRMRGANRTLVSCFRRRSKRPRHRRGINYRSTTPSLRPAFRPCLKLTLESKLRSTSYHTRSTNDSSLLRSRPNPIDLLRSFAAVLTEQLLEATLAQPSGVLSDDRLIQHDASRGIAVADAAAGMRGGTGEVDRDGIG